jgi:hypothetical protein
MPPPAVPVVLLMTEEESFNTTVWMLKNALADGEVTDAATF